MVKEITSRENPFIKLFCKVISSAKVREEEKLFAIEGLRLCREAALAGMDIEFLFITPKAQSRWQEELQLLKRCAKKVLLVEKELAYRIADTKSPQGVFCLCAIPKESTLRLNPKGKYILLDALQDPGNMGTILRGAEAFGISSVIMSGCPHLYSPKVLRSAMGSAFRLSIFKVQELLVVLKGMEEVGIFTCAADLSPHAIFPQKLPRQGGIALVMGNEGQGVSSLILAACKSKVCIPMAPSVESLNVAAAAMVLMWEMAGKKQNIHDRRE